MMLLYIPVAIALTCFILYALDRRSKQEPIDWFVASKLSLFGSLISGGIVYVMSSDKEVLKVDMQPIQEMFVGVPTF